MRLSSCRRSSLHAHRAAGFAGTSGGGPRVVGQRQVLVRSSVQTSHQTKTRNRRNTSARNNTVVSQRTLSAGDPRSRVVRQALPLPVEETVRAEEGI